MDYTFSSGLWPYAKVQAEREEYLRKECLRQAALGQAAGPANINLHAEIAALRQKVAAHEATIESLKAKAAKWDAHERVSPGAQHCAVNGCTHIGRHPHGGAMVVCCDHRDTYQAVLKDRISCHAPSETETRQLESKVNEARRENDGHGLRAQGGEYTEPGEVKVVCDHGWND